MKKLAKIFAAMTMSAIFVAGCAQAPPPAPPSQEAGQEAEAGEAPDTADAAEGFELVLVTDIGSVDDRSFNQGAWEGLVSFATANNITHTFFQPTNQSIADYLSAIELAVNAGARLVVTPGFLFQNPIYIAQDIYPDIKFVFLDGVPQDEVTGQTRIEDNVMAIIYAEEQAGFLAGYAAVMEGHRSLGFMGGMAVPAVVRFGYGFLQGADHAAITLGLEPGEVSVMYHYTGGFNPTPEAQTLAASWFNLGGVEVIFAAGGGMNSSVFAAAEAHEGLVIGVDIDQSIDSPTVLTSAMKELGNSVYSAIADFYNGTWQGGQVVRFDASIGGVGLPMETSRFQNFTQEQYDAIFAQLADGSITVNDEHTITIEELALEMIEIAIVN